LVGGVLQAMPQQPAVGVTAALATANPAESVPVIEAERCG
jgi:hypothetical protein